MGDNRKGHITSSLLVHRRFAILFLMQWEATRGFYAGERQDLATLTVGRDFGRRQGGNGQVS